MIRKIKDNSKDRAYAGHLIWHMNEIMNAMSLNIDTTPHVKEMLDHLTPEDKKIVDEMRIKDQTKEPDVLDRFSQMVTNNLLLQAEGADETEKQRILNDVIARQEIRRVVDLLDSKELYMSEEYYRTGKMHIPHELMEELNKTIEKIKNFKPLTQEEIDKRLNL